MSLLDNDIPQEHMCSRCNALLGQHASGPRTRGHDHGPHNSRNGYNDGARRITVYISPSKRAYVAPFRRVHTLERLVQYISTLPHPQIRFVTNANPAKPKSKACEEFLYAGQWQLLDSAGCIIRPEDWEELVYDGIDVTVDTAPYEDQVIPDNPPILEPVAVNNDKGKNINFGRWGNHNEGSEDLLEIRGSSELPIQQRRTEVPRYTGNVFASYQGSHTRTVEDSEPQLPPPNGFVMPPKPWARTDRNNSVMSPAAAEFKPGAPSSDWDSGSSDARYAAESHLAYIRQSIGKRSAAVAIAKPALSSLVGGAPKPNAPNVYSDSQKTEEEEEEDNGWDSRVSTTAPPAESVDRASRGGKKNAEVCWDPEESEFSEIRDREEKIWEERPKNIDSTSGKDALIPTDGNEEDEVESVSETVIESKREQPAEAEAPSRKDDVSLVETKDKLLEAKYENESRLFDIDVPDTVSDRRSSWDNEKQKTEVFTMSEERAPAQEPKPSRSAIERLEELLRPTEKAKGSASSEYSASDNISDTVSKPSAESLIKSLIDPSIENAFEGSPGSSVKSSIAPIIKMPIEPPLRSPLKPAVRKPVEPPIKSPIKLPPPVEKSVEPPIKSLVKSSVEESVESPVKSPSKSPIKRPIVSPIKSPMKSPVVKPAELPMKSPIKPSVEASTKPIVESRGESSGRATGAVRNAEPEKASSSQKQPNPTTSLWDTPSWDKVTQPSEIQWNSWSVDKPSNPVDGWDDYSRAVPVPEDKDSQWAKPRPQEVATPKSQPPPLVWKNTPGPQKGWPTLQASSASAPAAAPAPLPITLPVTKPTQAQAPKREAVVTNPVTRPTINLPPRPVNTPNASARPAGQKPAKVVSDVALHFLPSPGPKVSVGVLTSMRKVAALYAKHYKNKKLENLANNLSHEPIFEFHIAKSKDGPSSMYLLSADKKLKDCTFGREIWVSVAYTGTLASEK